MRRFAILFAVLGLLGLAMSHQVLLAQPGKQLICHIADDQQAFIIEVAVPAVPFHLEQHGDCTINSTERSLIGEPCDPTDANTNDICDVQP